MSEATFRTKFINKFCERTGKKKNVDIFVEFADAGKVNGIPDLIIFYKKKYARIETKREQDAAKRLHQEYYINMFKKQGIYAEFLMPENEEEIINGLRRYFKI